MNEPSATNHPTIVAADWLLAGFSKGGTPIIHQNAAVLVDKGCIQALGPVEELRAQNPAAHVIGGAGKAIIPGLVNAHHHVGLTPFQLGSPDHPLETWFASRLALRDVDLRLDTLFSAFEMVASGVTTVQHLHSRAPGNTDDVVTAGRTVMEAYREIGMRCSYSMALRDQNRLAYEDDAAFTERVPKDIQPMLAAFFKRFTIPLDEQLSIFEALRHSAESASLTRVQIAPANLHWLSDKAIEAAGQLSSRHGLPMHMHLLETPYQKEYARRRTGGSAFQFIHEQGLTGPHLTIGHGVWMTEDDIALCKQTGTRVCHNCSSNMRLKSGRAPVTRFLAEGIPVAIGMDEAGINEDRDMLQEMRMVLHSNRAPGINSSHPTSAQVMRMATEHGAATTPFGDRIGRLTVGAAADLVVLDWGKVTFPYQDHASPLVDVLVHRAKTSSVETVMVEGETIYHEGHFVRIDRDETLREIAVTLRRPLNQAELDRITLSHAVFPHVSSFYHGWLDDV